jgi:hypothetical protein
MNKKNKGFIIPFTILCILLISGCYSQSNNKSTNSNTLNKVQAYNVTFDNSALRTYIDIYETKLLYMETNESAADFYIYNFQNGSKKKILTVENFVLKGISNTFINDTLFFYVSLYKGEDLENNLYAVNFSEDKMYVESKNINSQKLIPLTSVDGNLIALQGNVLNNGDFTSFIEMRDKAKNTNQVHLDRGIKTQDSNTNSRQIVYITSDDKYLYAIEKSNSDSHLNCFITKYDLDFTLVNEINITNIIKEYDITSGVGSFFVFDHYFSITDYSNHTIVGDLVENTNRVIFYENDVEYIKKYADRSPYEFFYKRNTNEIYRFDPPSGKIQVQKFNLDNTSSDIRVVLSYGDQFLIVKQPIIDNDKNENVYLIPKNYEPQ